MAWPSWPGTANGVSSPHWGTNVQLYVRALIAAGTQLKWGPDPADWLDSGYVWAKTTVDDPTPPAGMMWVELGCDVINMTIHTGTDQTSPFAHVAEAGTLDCTLYDPGRIYDPMNPDSPFVFGGISRLGEGVQIQVWAEVLNTPTTVTRYNLFTGTVDTWAEDWEAHPEKRRARVVASDCTKQLANLDWGEQPSVGNGDYQAARIQRILTYYGWTGPQVLDNTLTRYQATTLAQSAWELLGRVMTDDNGFILIDGDGAVATAGSNRWTVRNPTLTMTVGCGVTGITGLRDIVLDVTTTTSSIWNSISASRTGGTMSKYTNATSIAKYGEQGAPKRTDLGLYDDAEVAKFAGSVLQVNAFPHGEITSVTLRPSLDQVSWGEVFRSFKFPAKEAIRVLWSPGDSPTVYDAKGRPFGVEHSITRGAWDVKYALAMANVYTRVMHWGVAAYDQLDAGNVYV